MDYNSVFAISGAGMAIERARVEVAALNLANAHTVAGPGQAAYRPLRVAVQAAVGESFAGLMNSASSPSFHTAPAYQIEPSSVEPRRAHEPGHPMADARGFVSYPGVDTATELVAMMDATRAYEANLAAVNTARTLALKALDIGGQS